ncbi:MAG TPA: CPBP family intramembrane metalloprotease [Rhodocyclaceae bacterium]|nr:CPBP family intramembrane metalloprotease [Rhodocyclaceae bacterium]
MTSNSLRYSLYLTLLPPLGALLNGLYNGPLYRLSPSLFWLADFVLFVVAPIFIVSWLAKVAYIHPRDYGLNPASFKGVQLFVTSLLFALILFAVYEFAKYVGWMLAWRWYVEPDFSYGTATPEGLWRPVVVLYWALTAGLMESIFYIGLPWYLWRNKLGLTRRRHLFLFLSALVFAAVHWEQGVHNAIGAFGFGLAACLLYWKVNDLWPIVGAHVLVDLYAFS